MKTGLTIEQYERLRASYYGRYEPETNTYEMLGKPPEMEKCDFCGLYHDPEELKTENSLWSFRYCPKCASVAYENIYDELSNEADDERYRNEMLVLAGE